MDYYQRRERAFAYLHQALKAIRQGVDVKASLLSLEMSNYGFDRKFVIKFFGDVAPDVRFGSRLDIYCSDVREVPPDPKPIEKKFKEEQKSEAVEAEAERVLKEMGY